VDDAPASTCDLPPDGFDPLTAPQELLLRYGLPRRPDPEAEPELTRLFRRAFSRPRNFVKHELVADPALGEMLGRRRPGFGEGEWAAAIISTSADEQPVVAFTQFAVPSVQGVDPEIDEPLVVGFWVGIGGVNDDDVAGSLLQAGVAAMVTPGTDRGSGNVSYWAWTEWYPAAPSHRVANFEVTRGDVVSVIICGGQGNRALIILENTRTNTVMSVPMHRPAGVTAAAPSAVWAVETLSTDTPRFSPVTFLDCLAVTEDFTTLNLTDAIPYNRIIGSSGYEARAAIDSPSSLTVDWVAFQ
jgi:hypothetical protein